MQVLTRILLIAAALVLFAAPAAGSDLGPAHWTVAWAATVPYYGSVMASDDDGTVVVGYDGETTSLSPRGVELWTTNDELAEVTNRPVLVDGVVVVPGRDQIRAVARSNGATLWQRALAEARLAVAERSGRLVVIVSSPNGTVTLLDPATGGVLLEWILPVPPSDSAPLVFGSGDLVVAAWGGAGRCCTVAGFATSDGGRLWQRRLPEDSTEPVVHAGLVVIAMNGIRANHGRVVAFDAATGKSRWRRPVRGIFRPTLKGAADGDLLVVTSRDGAALALSVATGERRWRSRGIIPDGRTDPQIASDHVFLTPHSSDLVAMDRRTGEIVSAGPIEQTIVVTDSNVVGGHFQLLVTNGFEGQVWNLEEGGPTR